MVRQRFRKPSGKPIAGSNPVSSSKFFATVAKLERHDLGKVEMRRFEADR